MRELVNSDGLGGFRVLIQERRTGIDSAEELTTATGDIAGGESDPSAPLLGPEHISVKQGRWPETTWELTELWPPDAG